MVAGDPARRLMARPILQSFAGGSLPGEIARAADKMNLTYNLVPSLHVTFAVLLGAAVHRWIYCPPVGNELG